MNEKEFFYQFGKLIYQIDGIYEEYGRKSNIYAPNLLWILYSLNDGQEHSQKQICDDWLIPRSTVNTIIKDLEAKGYVTLHQIQGKRRELKLVLTTKGQEYASIVLKDLYEKESRIYNKLKNPEKILELLKDLVSKLQFINM